MSARKPNAGRKAQSLPAHKPWPIRGAKGNRKARKQFTASLDRIAGEHFTAMFNEALAESQRLMYPRVSTRHFLRLFFQGMDRQIVSREQGSGVSR